MTGTSGAVVVVNYASSGLLQDNLVALGRGQDAPRILVVDNFSSAAERATVVALAASHGWELVLQDNRGFSAGINAGAARAAQLGCDSMLLLNPDVEVDGEVVHALLRHVADEPSALVTPSLLNTDGSTAFAAGTLDLTRGTTRTRGPLDPALEPWLSGACLAMSLHLWRRLGGLAEDYFMYWEDVELSYRCRALGGRLVVRDDLTAVHAVGGTQGAGKSPLYLYYNCRNRLLFARRNLSRKEAVRWLRFTPRYAWRVMLRNGRRAVVTRPRETVVPVLSGSLSGARLALLGR